MSAAAAPMAGYARRSNAPHPRCEPARRRALVMATAFDSLGGNALKSPAGLLLAAGAGSRMGTPKALVNDWLVRGVDVLSAAGCTPIVVVLGAAHQQARALL